MAGNFIGTDVTGTLSLGIANNGVFLAHGASLNWIGVNPNGSAAIGDLGNLISGNGDDGVDISYGSDGNVIAGNKIGTDLTGGVALGNAGTGVFINGASSNWIGVNPNGGAAVSDEGNVISGNGYDGVLIVSGANGNVVAGNKIGTDATGSVALVNRSNGIDIEYAASNTIGGTTSGAGNLIAGNGPAPQEPLTGYGVMINGQGANGNVVAGNTIGTDITGTVALGNALSYVGFGFGSYGANNTIGGLITSAGVFHGFDFASVPSSGDLTLQSDISSLPQQQTDGGSTVVYHVDVETEGQLLAIVSPRSFTAQLMLLDSHGRVLVQSDGLSPSDPDPVIDQDLVPGGYSLVVESTGGAGTYTLTASMTLSSAPFQPIPVNPGPAVGIGESMVAGNFTGDGHLDLAIADSYAVEVLLGNGDGTFQPPIFYSTGLSGYEYMVAGDFTGDGRIDLAVAGLEYDYVTNTEVDGVAVLLGNGDGTFQPPATYADGLALTTNQNNVCCIVAGDFNGDGRIDLAVAGYNYNSVTQTNVGEVSVLLGNGDGTFQPASQYAVEESSPGSLVAGDFTSDGRTDLAVAGYNFGTNADVGEVSVLVANDDGTFQPPVTYALGFTGFFPMPMVAGNFTGNGHLDLAVAGTDNSTGYGEVSVLLGNGDGTFQPPVTDTVAESDVSPEGMADGDFTGDGRTDLAVTYYFGSKETVSLLLGNGDGTFQPPVTDVVGGVQAGSIAYGFGGGQSIVAGDFTGDGRTDLALDNGPSVSVLLANGDGTFQSTVTNAADGGPTSIATGDFNGDGRTDLVVTNALGNSVSVFLGKGDGTFQPQVTYAVGLLPDAIVAGDFNGDGRTDLAVANSGDNTVSVLLGNGDGTFQRQITYAVGENPDGIVAGDFTGDGILDLAVACQGNEDMYPPGTDPGGVYVLLGNGDGTFQPAQRYATGESPFSIVAGDFNSDGRLDLAVAGNDYQDPATNTVVGEVSVLLGNGDGTFQPAKEYAAGGSSQLVAGDFTGNGKLDLVVDSGGIQMLLGNGDGTFQPAKTVAAAINGYNGYLAAGDFTGDGHLDLAVTSYYYSSVTQTDVGEISVLLGNGDSTFQPPVSYAADSLLGTIVAGDFTGDGRLDLATPNLLDDTVSVLLGNGDGTFTDPGQLATSPHATPLVADVSGDGTDDVLVVDGAGNILYRQGIPGQPGSFEPPVTVQPIDPSTGAVEYPSRDIAWVPNTMDGPLLASVDAQDDAISFFAYRDGGFVPVGSLTTGQLPAQIIAADLNGSRWDDLIVRNAGDGTLTVFFNNQLGSFLTGFDQPFLPPLSIPVGLGVSDVQAISTNADGHLDLVVTNKLTGQVGVLYNDGDDRFAALVPYRAGTGASAIDPGSTPEVTSLEATAGVAGGPLTPDGPNDLVTINPGANTLDVLANLGGGWSFANPVTTETASPAEVVHMADFNGDGIADLAVLTAQGASIYLGNGKGGFSPPVTYDAGVDPSGLTVADVLGNGQLDLLVGNAYGDVLILVGDGDGTFRPFEPVKADIALAVADLTGNGARDFVYADQSLNQITVVYGSPNPSSTNSHVVGDQATGILAPGAVLLADLIPSENPEDDIPDLIVANSGGNNVLVYPGLGNGQFGPPINGTQGFPVGTDPTGLAVADLNGQPDLLVADTGSNDVSVLLGQGKGPSWTMIPGPRVQTGAGPVAVAVGDLLGSGQTDLAVANSGADDVQIFPGVGGGFFNDQKKAVTTVPVGQSPSSLFLGDFNGLGQGLATLNTGSNDGTLITDLGALHPPTQTFATGGDAPTSGFAGNFTGDGFTDLVVGNNGDGHLALLLGGPGGLSLSQTLTSPAVPEPTGLSFAGVSDGTLSFYASTSGREVATEMAFALSPGVTLSGAGLGAGAGESSSSALASATVGTFQQVAQLLSANGTTLSLIAPLFTVSIVAGEFAGFADVEGGVALLANTLPGTGPGSLGQPARNDRPEPSVEGADDPGPASGPVAAAPAPTSLPVWDRIATGLEQAWEQVRVA